MPSRYSLAIDFRGLNVRRNNYYVSEIARLTISGGKKCLLRLHIVFRDRRTRFRLLKRIVVF